MPSIFLSSNPSVTATIGAISLPKPRVAVYFRPANGYNGSFGFDWIRTGDTSPALGDSWYRDIIGSYSSGSFIQSNSDYSRLLSKYQSQAHPTRNNDKYVVPIAALMKGEKAKFTLKLDVNKEAREIKIECDSRYFTLNEELIADRSLGKRTLVNFLEIECIEEFDSNQILDVKADGEFGGRIIFLANDRGHQGYRRIQLVRVQVDLDSSGAVSSPVITGESGNLRKFLKQALTNAGIWTKDLDLSSDATMTSTHRVTMPSGQSAVKYSAALAPYLTSRFAAANAGLENHFKIFFFAEKGGSYENGSYEGLNGFAEDIISKTVVLFDTHNAASTIHELLHAIGLYHTFDDSNDFTFEEAKTDNIMDYSHRAIPPISRKSTWYWQWKKINPKLSGL